MDFKWRKKRRNAFQRYTQIKPAIKSAVCASLQIPAAESALKGYKNYISSQIYEQTGEAAASSTPYFLAYKDFPMNDHIKLYSPAPIVKNSWACPAKARAIKFTRKSVDCMTVQGYPAGWHHNGTRGLSSQPCFSQPETGKINRPRYLIFSIFDVHSFGKPTIKPIYIYPSQMWLYRALAYN